MGKKHLTPASRDFRVQVFNLDTLLLLCLYNMNLRTFYFHSSISPSSLLSTFEVLLVLLYSFDFKICILVHVSWLQIYYI